MKQTILALKAAIELSIARGEPIEFELDGEVSHTLPDTLAFALGHSFSWVELVDGGWRLDGKGELGEFTLLLNNLNR